MHGRHHDDASTVTAEPMLHLLQKLASPPFQSLIVTQPTLSSVYYTVSTRPPPKTVTGYGRHYARLILRVVIGVLALLALLIKWDMSNGRQWISDSTGDSVDGTRMLAHSLQEWPWRYVLPAVAVMLWLVLRRGYSGTLGPCIS